MGLSNLAGFSGKPTLLDCLKAVERAMGKSEGARRIWFSGHFPLTIEGFLESYLGVEIHTLILILFPFNLFISEPS